MQKNNLKRLFFYLLILAVLLPVFLSCAHRDMLVTTAVVLLIVILTVKVKNIVRTQRHITHELKRQKDLFDLLINSMPVGIEVKDARQDLKCVFCNHSAANIYAVKADEIIGKTVFEIFTEKIARQIDEEDRKVIMTGRMCKHDKILKNFGQGGIWLKEAKLPIYDESGQIYLLLNIVEDVTEGVKLESQLQHAQRMDEVGRLAGGIAHEFNNLLQVIIGYCEFIREDDDKKAIEENLEQIEQASNNAMELTGQLLTYSRKSEPQKKDIDVNHVIDNTLKMIRRLIEPDVKFEFFSNEEKIMVFADPGQLEQVLLNLCINARDAMEGNGNIEIETQLVLEAPEAIEMGIRRDVGQHFALIKITDNGPGISDNLKNRIFEPFFTTKEVGKGTGLGLPIVYAIMKQHGGYVFIDQEYHDGARMLLYLPLSEQEARKEFAKTDVVCQTKLKPEKITILIAEDEKTVRHVLTRTLKKVGFNYIEAENGQEALQKFKAHKEKIDMLLFDVMMPELNGKDAYNSIKKISSDIPVLFCTGYSDELLKKELSANRNVVLLQKPYRSKELIKEIFKLLENKAV
jgi:PAS domain S-box-containing protein